MMPGRKSKQEPRPDATQQPKVTTVPDRTASPTADAAGKSCQRRGGNVGEQVVPRRTVAGSEPLADQAQAPCLLMPI
jgi:hypothetical protein